MGIDGHIFPVATAPAERKLHYLRYPTAQRKLCPPDEPFVS